MQSLSADRAQGPDGTLPVRQWVLIWVMRLPILLRLLLAAQPKRVTPVRRWCTGRVPSGPWAQVG